MGYFEGFLVTLRQQGKKNRVTTQYSGGRVRKRAAKKGKITQRAEEFDAKVPKPERMHGRHVLNRYEDGMEKCIGCELCAAVCPAKCIHVRGADNDPQNPTSPGERFGWIYEINYLRCIHCDLCVEACPTEAITETKLFEFSFTTTPFTPRTNSSWATMVNRNSCRGRTGAQAKTSTRRHGCGQLRRRVMPPSRASSDGVVNWVTAHGRQKRRRTKWNSLSSCARR